MPSWPETSLVHPDDVHRVAPARLDAHLRTSTLVGDLRADARLVDPRLVDVVQEAAREAAERGYAAGREEGAAQGLAAGRAQAEQEAACRREADQAALSSALERLTAVASALRAAADDLERRSAPAHGEAGAELGAVVCDLVEALLGRELESDRLHVVDSVRRAAEQAVRGAPLVVHLNPADAATVAEAGVDLSALAHRPVSVVADAGVERGGAVADSGARHIDATLSGALDRLREELCR